MKVVYEPNNSGGVWWLKDKDWKALEKAGWYVVWGGKYFCHSTFNVCKWPAGKPKPACPEDKKCSGHRIADSAKEAKEHRFLDALACNATKEFKSIKEALQEFEKITGQDVSDEGCNCCGAPHYFVWSSKGCLDNECGCKGLHEDYHYCSGEKCLKYLYPGKKMPSMREAMEKL